MIFFDIEDLTQKMQILSQGTITRQCQTKIVQSHTKGDRGLYQGIIRCRPKNSEAVALRSGAHGGLMCPIEKGVMGIEISKSPHGQHCCLPQWLS
jgi:hypothetical protein